MRLQINLRQAISTLQRTSHIKWLQWLGQIWRPQKRILIVGIQPSQPVSKCPMPGFPEKKAEEHQNAAWAQPHCGEECMDKMPALAPHGHTINRKPQPGLTNWVYCSILHFQAKLFSPVSGKWIEEKFAGISYRLNVRDSIAIFSDKFL